MKNIKIVLTLILMYFFGIANAQFSEIHAKGYKICIDNDENRYIRFILFGQVQSQYSEVNPDIDFSIRRVRFITFGQITPNFLVFMHLGLNSFNSEKMDPLGVTSPAQFFLHDFWLEYKLMDELYVGTGLHYWGGISRQNNIATLSLMTLDADRTSWSTIGLSDQFVRHLGVYAKGQIDQFGYQVSVNSANTNSLQKDIYKNAVDNNKEGLFYAGKYEYKGKANLNYAGYFEYYFLDKEVIKLPYRVGTYLGYKEIFNLGAGFFYHPKGIVELKQEISGNLIKQSVDVSHIAGDIYYDAPIGSNNSAINFYCKYQYSNMGKNYVLGDAIGTGSSVYTHFGYLLPKEEKNIRHRFMPYVSYSYRDFQGLSNKAQTFKTGINWFIDGHSKKLTIEYCKDFHKLSNIDDAIVIQAHVAL